MLSPFLGELLLSQPDRLPDCRLDLLLGADALDGGLLSSLRLPVFPFQPPSSVHAPTGSIPSGRSSISPWGYLRCVRPSLAAILILHTRTWNGMVQSVDPPRFLCEVSSLKAAQG